MDIVQQLRNRLRNWYSDNMYERLCELGINFIYWVARGKDRVLSQHLFRMAERYNTRPGTWNYDCVVCEEWAMHPEAQVLLSKPCMEGHYGDPGPIRVIVTGFTEMAEAEAFVDWYVGQGQDNAEVWFAECKYRGEIKTGSMYSEYPFRYDGWDNVARLKLKMDYE